MRESNTGSRPPPVTGQRTGAMGASIWSRSSKGILGTQLGNALRVLFHHTLLSQLINIVICNMVCRAV